MSELHRGMAGLGSRICKKYFGTKLQKCKMSLCFSVFLCFFSILLFNQLYFDKGTFYYETSNFYIFLVLLMVEVIVHLLEVVIIIIMTIVLLVIPGINIKNS